MNRDEKSAAIEEIAAQIEGAEAIFAVDYRGISVSQAAELRAKLREADASFRVVKNRLTQTRRRQGGGGRASPSCSRARPRSPSSAATPRRRREGDLDLQQRARRPHLQGRLHGRTRPRRGQVQVDRPPALPRSPRRPARRRRRQPADRPGPRPRLDDLRASPCSSGQIAEKGLVTGEAPQGDFFARGAAPRRGGPSPRKLRSDESSPRGHRLTSRGASPTRRPGRGGRCRRDPGRGRGRRADVGRFRDFRD